MVIWVMNVGRMPGAAMAYASRTARRREIEMERNLRRNS
jgi:hypothetical protein